MSPVPRDILPMLATPGKAFDSPGYTFEVKWDGVRALAYKENDAFWMQTRNLKAALPRFPELAGVASSVGAAEAVLDGEIVIVGVDGRPDFHLVRSRNAQKDPRVIEHASRSHPAVYIAFDCLFRDGESLMSKPLQERRQHLDSIVEPSDCAALSTGVTGTGVAYFDAVRAQGLEGIVAKSLEAPYLPGRRSPHWIKVRNVQSADCVIGGFVPKGRTLIKSLLLGLYDLRGTLRYIGHVGTGFSTRENEEIRRTLERLTTDSDPFSGISAAEARGAQWVIPEMVCSVEYLTWTPIGHLRHPSFQGLRHDKEAAACRLADEFAQ